MNFRWAGCCLAALVTLMGPVNSQEPQANDAMRSIASIYVPNASASKAYSMEELDDAFLGDTVLLALSGGRYRVAYFAHDGEMSVWFPGRDYVGKAQFGFIDGRVICVDSTKSGAVGRSEITCQTIDQLNGAIKDRAEGDLFNLSTLKTPPWNLPETIKRFSLAGVQKTQPK